MNKTRLFVILAITVMMFCAILLLAATIFLFTSDNHARAEVGPVEPSVYNMPISTLFSETGAARLCDGKS